MKKIHEITKRVQKKAAQEIVLSSLCCSSQIIKKILKNAHSSRDKSKCFNVI